MGRPAVIIPAEGSQGFLPPCRLSSPEIEKHWLAPKCGDSLGPSSQVWKRKVWSGYRHQQPGFNRSRECVSLLQTEDPGFAMVRRLCLEEFHPRRFDTLFDPHRVIGREVVKFLYQSTRPPN